MRRIRASVGWAIAENLLDELAWVAPTGATLLVAQLGPVSLLILDFLLIPASVEACRELLEVIEDRARSTLVASQLPVEKWHAAMADPALAEAVLDSVLRALTASSSTVPRCASASPNSPPPPTRDRSHSVNGKAVKSSPTPH